MQIIHVRIKNTAGTARPILKWGAGLTRSLNCEVGAGGWGLQPQANFLSSLLTKNASKATKNVC